MSAAISAATAALATSSQHGADAPTQPLTAVQAACARRMSRRRLLAGGWPFGGAAGGHGVLRGAGRRMFVTPWFAAATGVVIAAGLWIYSPHTVLQFPSSEPGVLLCKTAGCVRESNPQGGGSLAVSKPGVKINSLQGGHGHAGKPKADRSTAAAGLRFRFTVLWTRNNEFGATITVSGHQVPSSWRLSFEIPGAQIKSVTDVNWQANASDTGGTASAQSSQAGGGGDGRAGTGNRDGNTGGGPQPTTGQAGELPVITFVITGSGPANLPAHCVFDGASCVFSRGR